MGAKIKTPKNPWIKNWPPKNPMPNFPVHGVKWYNTKFKNVRNWMKYLFLRNSMWSYHDTRALPRILKLLWIPQESLLKTNQPIKIRAKSSFPKKSWNRKFLTQKKSFDHPCHLKSWVPPPRIFVRFKNLHHFYQWNNCTCARPKKKIDKWKLTAAYGRVLF